MKIPKTTHLQFAILRILIQEEMNGKTIRHELKKMRLLRTGPAFYQMMNRLEESGFITGRYSIEIINKQMIRDRFYKLTIQGRTAVQDAISFYNGK